MLSWLLSISLTLAAPSVDVVTVQDGPVIDGVLDDVAWALASPVQDFQRFQPVDGGAPAGTTEVRFVQDSQNLYIAVKVRDAGYKIRARVSPRESINADDQIGLYLDPFGDAQSGYIFYFNALGIQQDIRFNAGEWNVAWNAVYRSRGRVVDDGYDLEIAIPFRSLKYPTAQGASARSGQTWGLMLTRKIPSAGEKYGFPKLERGHPRMFTQAAPLRGVRPPNRGSGIELIPGLTVRMEATRPDTASAFTWTDLEPWHEVIRPSLDVRAGITPNIALIGSANPDFSQVESDVAPVLLNARFAFRFMERRPFFTEGAGFFDDLAGTLYSRSISQPLYGLKLAGREGAWSIGLLHAVDRAPLASFHERDTPGFSADDVAGKWSSNTMIRVRRDLPGAGWFGLTLTDKRMTTEAFRREGFQWGSRGHHNSLAVDAAIPFGRRWTASLFHDQALTGDAEEQIGGSATSARVSRASGEGLGMVVAGTFVSRDYRQELGFRTQSGFGQAAATVNWTHTTQGRVSSYTPSLSASVFEEVQGEHYRSVALGQTLVIDGTHRLSLEAGIDGRREDQDDTPFFVPGWFVDLGYSGQIGAAVEWRPRVRVSREMEFSELSPANRLQAQLDTTLRIAKPLRIDLLARYIRFDRPQLTDAVVQHDGLIRARIACQFSREWGLRLIGAYNQISERDPSLETSALVTWLLHPFTAVYAGYAERTQLGPSAGALDRSVFAKVQVMFRP